MLPTMILLLLPFAIFLFMQAQTHLDYCTETAICVAVVTDGCY